ncbi:hypothetical protein QKC54_gp0343 [Megavirus baoshan]|uniref:Uncharacterized protein n=1 Tax=Megavirus baoshan TaxID=2496520 RepID=A0A3Q8U824_9VIRU|nr:hypothetical protein QKC54_gp0343 [Megavirus baoshan]AZL89479.1 hypothetical protein Mb0729 [Megavirus baoshan]
MSTKKIVKALKISKIDVNKISIGSKNVNKKVPIYNENKPGLVYQTPFLQVKEKLRKVNENLSVKLYNFDTWFRGDSNSRISGFYQFIDNFEDRISTLVEDQMVKQINNNSTDKWFSKPNNVNIKSLIRIYDDDNQIYFIKWTLDLNNNIFIDENKNAFNPEDLDETYLVKLIIEVFDFWINDNQFAPAAVVRKVLVKKMESASEYEFDETESEGSDNEFISVLATEQKPKQNNKNTTKHNRNLNPDNKKEKIQEANQRELNLNRYNHKREEKKISGLRGNNDNYINVLSDDDNIFQE